MVEIKIAVRRLPGNDDIPSPSYMTKSASGVDLPAAVKKSIVIKPCCVELIPTGFQIAIPSGYEAQVRPRSGLALKYGIGVLNSPGTIDADYRGEIGVILINLGRKSFIVNRGDRIAQMVINKITRSKFILKEKLPATKRKDGGFGHTGK